MESYGREAIENSIRRGANYLILSQNANGGIKFQDHSEQGSVSGIWVTAEALEFFLTSKTLPLTIYKKVEPMINFLLDAQAQDGSWSVLPKGNTAISMEKEPSAIATGHCTYVLKLAAVGSYAASEKLRNAIKHGEDWLRHSCAEKDGYAFWEAKPTQKKIDVDPNKNESSRMEYIFTTFYAVLGLINPKDYPEDNDRDRTLIAKTISFFNNQAEYFINKYRSELAGLKTQYTKVASTFCRIVNGLTLMKAAMVDETRKGLKELLLACPDLFTTCNITFHVENIRNYAPAYNNNTPFDMANALINLEVNASDLKHIMDAYLRNQTAEGFWYLNFSSLFTVTTWSTVEALLILERALEQYDFIELEEQKSILEKEKEENNAKVNEIIATNKVELKQYKISLILSRVFSIFVSLAAIILFGVIIATQPLTEAMKWWVTAIFIPLGVNAVGTVGKWIIEAIKNRINKS